MTPKQTTEAAIEAVKDLTGKKRIQARTLLNRGLKAINAFGWCQGESVLYRDGKIVGYCATGSIDESFRGSSKGITFAYTALWAGVRKVMPTARHAYDNNNTGNIVDWNDKKGRTKAQVIKAFKEAIKLVSVKPVRRETR